ncbi:E3 ubiquitin-protein ligase RNF8-like [Prunus yedoensis var. nudiflora]|uniref:E3 ubiquitin-protein ligase RNF8-like n=1 Tax=Prunus yedoensis var. nudiflora TaxID=2094558 RepID=A0A314YW29_PRUYE|nr:E3 ubiquitin-protein ligase RNF8-like [Prunus yedoensis var. nudiflora]
MEEFVVGSEDVTCMPCSHVFHETCIRVWLDEDKPNCPVCRFDMPVVEWIKMKICVYDYAVLDDRLKRWIQ